MGHQPIIRLFLLLLLLHPSGSTTPPVRIVTPVYLKEVPGIVTYEGNLPVFFNVTMGAPEIPNDPNQCPFHETYCELKKEAFAVYQSMKDELAWNQEEGLMQIPRRAKRFIITTAAFIGGCLLGPVISKLTSGLFENGNDWKSHFNDLRESVVQQQQEIFRYHSVEKNLTEIIWKSLNTLKLRTDEIVKSTLKNEKTLAINLNHLADLLHVKTESDELHRALDSCRNKHIPIGLISPTLFMQKTREANAQLSTFGYKLAIKPEQVSHFLKLPIADCEFTTNNVLVTVNLPLVRRTANWNLNEIVHLKFAYKGQVCDLYPQEASFLAKADKRTVLINGHLLHYCNIYEHRLCLIPPYVKESSQSLNCVVGMLEGKSVTELSKSCSFRCASDTGLVINQIDQRTLVLTNVENITTICDSTVPQVHLPPKVGAIQVKLDCHCDIVVDGNILEKPFPCVNDAQQGELVFHVMPLLWTTLHSAVGKDSSLILTDHEQILEHSWPDNFPIFNLTPKAISIPPSVPLGWTYQDYWLMGLTVMMVCLFMVLCITLSKMRA